ncbi:MAG TPA: hypothetical protein VK922_07065 [Gemmatimonadaceae bacterium]|nr:hypothetical protein [Gemmatimonadaceae bacterium]
MMRHALTGGLAIGVLFLAACDSNRAITTEPAGGPAYGINLLLSPTNLPRGTARIPRPTTAPDVDTDTIGVTIRGLDSLTSGEYVVWLADSTGAAFTRATGELTVIRVDTVLNDQGDPVPDPQTFALGSVTGFTNGGPRHEIQFVTTRAMSGLTAVDSVQIVMVTMESQTGATTPSETRRILGARRAEGTDVSPVGEPRYRNAPLRFGNFDVVPAEAYVFSPQGRGRVMVMNDIMILNDSSLRRPPLGYYYATFVVKRDADNNIVDTVYLGPQTAPYPRRELSLRHADSVVVDPDVQAEILPAQPAGTWANAAPAAILAAATRVDADTVAALSSADGPFRGASQVFVTLESKSAEEGRMGPAILMRTTLPDVIRFGKP